MNLKKLIVAKTALDTYELTEVLGEGGAGQVYGGTSSEGTPIAVKVLNDCRS